MADQSPLLLTPGPLTTADATRAALGRDFGSRDETFIAINASVREQLVKLVADPSEYVCVPVQGSGTFAVEAALGTLVPRDGAMAVLVNGAYGRRICTIAGYLGRRAVPLEWAETEPVDVAVLDRALAEDEGITHVAAIHCETTTGLLNPIEAIAEVTAARGRRLIIDSMSAFGALPLHASETPFEAVVASSNKCLEGVPGFGFIVAREDALRAAEGNSHSLALDLHAQLLGFEKNQQWRFTPPTQVIAGLHAALELHTEEGGVEGRGGRYRNNCEVLVGGMRALGFETLLPDALQAPIIVTFHQPGDPKFDFKRFYDALKDRGFAIYPGKLTEVDTFRVGCIGQVFEPDLKRFVETVADVLRVQGVTQVGPAQ